MKELNSFVRFFMGLEIMPEFYPMKTTRKDVYSFIFTT